MWCERTLQSHKCTLTLQPPFVSDKHTLAWARTHTHSHTCFVKCSYLPEMGSLSSQLGVGIMRPGTQNCVDSIKLVHKVEELKHMFLFFFPHKPCLYGVHTFYKPQSSSDFTSVMPTLKINHKWMSTHPCFIWFGHKCLSSSWVRKSDLCSS